MLAVVKDSISKDGAEVQSSSALFRILLRSPACGSL